MKHPTLVVGLCMLQWTWSACHSARAIEPKPYTIGIAPSHVTESTAPLFSDRTEDWDEVREAIDFYKIYSLQATPPKWATELPVNSFATFTKKHGVAIDAEFGSFALAGGVGEGQAAAERARAMHAWLGDRGLQLRALHLDGPIRRLLGCRGKEDEGLGLNQAAEETAIFLSECRKTFPETQIGLITNWETASSMTRRWPTLGVCMTTVFFPTASRSR